MNFKNAKDMVEEYFNGQYEVLKFLGEGSFAQVFLVKQTFLNDKRAMKIIKEPLQNSKNIDPIFHEVRIASQLHHENIISIYDAGLIHDFAYFVLEYVSGGDLEDYRNSYIKMNRTIPIHISLDIIKQILSGLNVLHSFDNTIIHRDLKTKNILMNYDADGNISVKISDFGFARELSSNPQDFEIGGTKPYMAPECFKGIFSTETDVYAVGVIFYLLLTNEFPYGIDDFSNEELAEGKPWENEIKSIRSFNEDIPDYIEDLILKSLDTHPQSRFKDAVEFLDELNIALDRFKQSDCYKNSLNEMENDEIFDDSQDTFEFNESDFRDYPINDNIRQAFKLAKVEDGLDEAISILEKEVLRDYDIRRHYSKVLRLWKSEYPDAKLISESFTVTLKGENYKLAINLLKEAFAYNPILKDSYGHYIDLWSIFIDLNKDKDLIGAVNSLEALMDENDNVKDIYKSSIGSLKTYDKDRILEETLVLAENNQLIEASKLLEFLVSFDDEIKRDYAYKLSLYKQDLLMRNEIRRNTVDFAIDLGTSDSIIACFNGNESRIINNHLTGENHTPSAVFIDDSGEVHVGQIAKDAVINNPANAVSEFKLNMGFPIPFIFEKSNERMFPEELSAELLKDLKKSIFKQTNRNIEEIVITVPANSNPLKTKATKEAAELAGFKSVYLILEPVAAAIAYGLKSDKTDKGIWMVYDLGGGTFDVSLVKANGEEIEKLATSGEDNLGGKLFDWKIVDDYFIPKIVEDLNLSDFRRGNTKYLKIFAILKNEAEKAKIALSNLDEYEIVIENLFDSISDLDNDVFYSYDFKCTLTKEDMINVMKPFLKTTFNHCYEILDENDLSIEDVEKIILVGGSTLSTILREILMREFNRPLEYGINPLTVVAEGASIYAGTIEKQFVEPQNHKFALILDYEHIGFKDNIEIDGKVFSLEDKFSFLDYSIEIVNAKDNTALKSIDLDIDGNFKLNLDVHDDYNEFLINVYDEKNEAVELDENSSNSINYKHALNPGYPILSSSISLYLDEDSSLISKNDSNQLLDLKSEIPYVKEYLRRFNSSILIASKGDKLSINKKEILYTSDSIKKGDENSFIKLSFYSGELILASYNTLLGEIIIDGNDIIDDLPSGSVIELNIDIDESNLISFEVFIPYLRQSFNNSFTFNNYSNYDNYLSNYDNLRNKYDEIIAKYNILKDFTLDNEENDGEGFLDRVYENIDEIDKKETISYLNILIDMAKYDKIAIYPCLEYLNYLEDILEECKLFLNISNIDLAI